jgi:L-ascorbate metabolism protein UlaG (beta-lactamase superfamily)
MEFKSGIFYNTGTQKFVRRYLIMSNQFTYLGHGTFTLKTSKGKIILIDPWVMGNPACPDILKHFEKIDIMLITHAHFDHIADAVELAKKHKPQVVCIFETALWLQSKGVENTRDMNKGGSISIDSIKITMVHADHSCGILDDGKVLYGGEAVGYVVRLEDGFTFYHAGDTNVFGDMKIIGELYKPELALLPIGDLYTMSPLEASYAIRLLGCKKIIPMHYATFPPLIGTPDELKKLTADVKQVEIIAMKPGDRR